MSSVMALQQQHTSYRDRLKQLEVRVENIEWGVVCELPMLRDDVATIKIDLHKMQTLEFDLRSFMPKESEQRVDMRVVGLDLDFFTLMIDPAPRIVGAY